MTGNENFEDRMLTSRELDFYDAKGAIEAVLEAVNVDRADFSAATVKHLQKGQAAEIAIGKTTVGYIGRLNSDISSMYKFRQPVFVAEVNLDSVLAARETAINYRPLPRYPGISRDVSFIVDRSVTFEAIRREIESNESELCRNIEFVDEYAGKGLEENERSITVRFNYRSDERTLTEEDVESIHRRLVDSVVQGLGLRLRT